MDGSCSCDAFGDACTACVQQQQQTDDSGAFALLMLDAIPADYQFLDFVTVPASVAEEDAVAACIDECLQANAGGGGCVGATFDDSGSSGWRCILVSSYSGGEEAASPGSRFFVTTRCTACSDGFALLNSTCARASIGLKSLGVGLSYWYSLMFGVKCVCVCVCVCLVGCCCCCAIALPASHPCHPPNSLLSPLPPLAEVTAPPEFPEDRVKVLIPINAAVGTVITTLTATSDAPGSQVRSLQGRG